MTVQHTATARPALRSAISRHRGPSWVGVGVAAVVMAMVASLAASLLSSTPGYSATPSPPPVPSTGAYLGAFVAPHQSLDKSQTDIRLELSEIGNFDGVFGRPLGLVHVFQNWSQPVKDSVLAAFASTGATPVVDWSCTSDANIIDGSQDALITSYADALKAYGRPVFLRWFWEMNLVNLPRNSNCLGTLGASGYVMAWQHIVDIFQQQGATNVSFVWCPSIAGGAGFAAAYYPGNQFVGWIGFDGYDRAQNSNFITTEFLPFYEHWLPNQKPMMIGETGATSDQASYLANLATDLPATFPGIKAVLYYDSQSTSDWTLVNTPGDRGLSQFIAMGELPYFSFPFTGS